MTDARFDVLGLYGSLRSDSFNRRLLEAAVRLAPPSLDIAPISIGRIPPYNADVEKQALPPSVQRLKDAVDRSHGLLIVTPEYNAGIPGVLKNAIDWLSRPAFRSPLVGKPAALVGATPGRRGAADALLQLRKVLESTLAEPLPGSLGVAQVHEKLRGEELTDQALAESLVQLLARLEQAMRSKADGTFETEPARAAS